ncbi:MAG: hypothetical protein IJN43_16205 [Ruminococcus sp.]|nr:hypothetical protein [Oscillospiraceae bacterium]MBQ6945842.1 hypothetical protein [Ruminococcus sp.]
MSMGDEVAGATLQVGTKLAEASIDTVAKAVDRTIDNIAKLLQALSVPRASKEKPVKSTDLTELKTGEVKIKKLLENARKTGDSVSSSDHGLTQADMKYVARKAKEYGIPVAFTGTKGKDNIYANVRSKDLPILQRICTDLMKEKLEVRPQELGNFKAKQWEIPFITAELNKHDLAAQFGKTKNGEYFCLYEKADEKAILIARGEFVRKCDEIKKDITFDRDEQGYLTIKDVRSGKEISFEEPPSREELSAMIQEQFDYDQSKADIVCAKFGEEMLEGEAKQKFFSNAPQNAFSKVDANIEVQGESVLTKEYSCWRMTPKSDGVPRIVFRDNDGNFAVLNPEKMTQRQMAERLQTQLKITDAATVLALVDKAQKVSDYYATQENHSLDYTFKKSDFDMRDEKVISGMHRTDAAGNAFAKALPVSSISNEIERTSKNHFFVTSAVTSIETDQHGVDHSTTDTQILTLSFSDKKNGVKELMDLYKKQGVPEHIAKQMAQDVFRQAETQSAEKILLVEEVRAESAVISHAGTAVEIDTTDPQAAAEKLKEEFEVSEGTAEAVVAKTADAVNPLALEELVQDDINNTFGYDADAKETTIPDMDGPPLDDDPPFDELHLNGHEAHVTDVLHGLKTDASAQLPETPEITAPKLPDTPPTAPIGGRH